MVYRKVTDGITEDRISPGDPQIYGVEFFDANLNLVDFAGATFTSSHPDVATVTFDPSEQLALDDGTNTKCIRVSLGTSARVGSASLITVTSPDGSVILQGNLTVDVGPGGAMSVSFAKLEAAPDAPPPATTAPAATSS